MADDIDMRPRDGVQRLADDMVSFCQQSFTVVAAWLATADGGLQLFVFESPIRRLPPSLIAGGGIMGHQLVLTQIRPAHDGLDRRRERDVPVRNLDPENQAVLRQRAALDKLGAGLVHPLVDRLCSTCRDDDFVAFGERGNPDHEVEWVACRFLLVLDVHKLGIQYDAAFKHGRLAVRLDRP